MTFKFPRFPTFLGSSVQFGRETSARPFESVLSIASHSVSPYDKNNVLLYNYGFPF